MIVVEKAMADRVGRWLGSVRRAATRDAAADGSKTVARKAAETFGEDGVRIDVEAAMRQWSKDHPRVPTKAELRSLKAGRDGAYAADFVTPIVTYVPRNPLIVPDAAEAARLAVRLQANARVEREAYRALPEADRKVYQALKRKLNSRPDGQLALQQLLLDGKLTWAAAANPKRNLIQALGGLADAPLASGIKERRTSFVAQLVQELADPVAVSQHYKGTCAATTRGQIKWSLERPTDYVDFLADLAGPKGKAKLPNGTKVSRPPDWAAGNDRAPDASGLPGVSTTGGRTISSQLTEPVFMQTAYGGQYRYSNTFDSGFDWKQANKQIMDGGLYGEQEARLMESLFPGKEFQVVYPSAAERAASYAEVPKRVWKGQRVVARKETMIKTLAATAGVDKPIATGVDYQLGGGHAILVTGVKELEVTRRTPKGKLRQTVEKWIEYINPWGQKEVQRDDAFKLVLTGLTTDGGSKGVVGH